VERHVLVQECANEHYTSLINRATSIHHDFLLSLPAIYQFYIFYVKFLIIFIIFALELIKKRIFYSYTSYNFEVIIRYEVGYITWNSSTVQPKTRSAMSPTKRHPMRYPVSSFKFTFMLNFAVFSGVRIPLPAGQLKFIQESCRFSTTFLHKALKKKVKRNDNIVFLALDDKYNVNEKRNYHFIDITSWSEPSKFISVTEAFKTAANCNLSPSTITFFCSFSVIWCTVIIVVTVSAVNKIRNTLNFP